MIGVVGGVLSQATTVLDVCCSYHQDVFDWGCWWCVAPGHYCFGSVRFSPPGHVLIGVVGGVLPQATTVVVGVLFSPPGRV